MRRVRRTFALSHVRCDGLELTGVRGDYAGTESLEQLAYPVGGCSRLDDDDVDRSVQPPELRELRDGQSDSSFGDDAVFRVERAEVGCLVREVDADGGLVTLDHGR